MWRADADTIIHDWHDTFEKEYLHLFYSFSSTFSKVFVTWHGRDEIVNKFVLFFSFLSPFVFDSSLCGMGLFQLGKKGIPGQTIFMVFPCCCCCCWLKENRVLFFLFLQSFGYRQKRVSLLIWSRWHRHERRTTCVLFSYRTIAIASAMFFISAVRGTNENRNPGSGPRKTFFSTSLDLFLFLLLLGSGMVGRGERQTMELSSSQTFRIFKTPETKNNKK